MTEAHYITFGTGRTACNLTWKGVCPYDWTRNKAKVTCRQCRNVLRGRS